MEVHFHYVGIGAKSSRLSGVDGVEEDVVMTGIGNFQNAHTWIFEI